MRIHPVGGNIVDVAPSLAEASVLWLRSGFNNRDRLGRYQLRERYPGDRLVPHDAVKGFNPRSRQPSIAGSFPVEPWRSETDLVFQVNPPDDHLQYVYTFANPSDAAGCADVQEIDVLVQRCLKRLAELAVRRIAMMHIPFARRQQLENRQACDAESAQAMIASLLTWDERNPTLIEEVFLIDLENGFAQLF